VRERLGGMSPSLERPVEEYDAVDGVRPVEFEDDAAGVEGFASFRASREALRDSATSSFTSS
jgi:hypothetical protein